MTEIQNTGASDAVKPQRKALEPCSPLCNICNGWRSGNEQSVFSLLDGLEPAQPWTPKRDPR